MDAGRTDISVERKSAGTPLSSHFDPSQYLKNFTAANLTSHEPHIEQLLAHLRKYGSSNAFTYSDPIHGDRTFPEWMLKIIDTPPLLRLSQVGQMTLLSHSRLSHSIGVAILALDLADVNHLDESHKKLLVSLALLHDVRHGPYSHLFDHLYIDDKENWFDHDARLHEFLSQPELQQALSDAQVDEHKIVQILKDPKTDPNGYIVKEILDRVDYAIRDAENSAGLFSAKYKMSICDAAMVLFCRVQYDQIDGSFYFPDSPDMYTAIEKFVSVRQDAFDRLVYDEDRRLTESLIYTAIKNMLVESNGRENAGKLVVALSHLCDSDLEALFPQAATAVLRQAKRGEKLGIIRIDGVTLTPHFKDLRGRTNGGRGATNTIIDELKKVDPESNFLVAIVPLISPKMNFKIRCDNGEYKLITGRNSNSPGGVYDQTKCIAISRYRAGGIPSDHTDEFRAQVQKVFLAREWIHRPDIQLESAAFTCIRDEAPGEATAHTRQLSDPPEQTEGIVG